MAGHILRLLLLTKDFPPHVGGIQTYCAELATLLARHVVALAVVAPKVPGHEAVDRGLEFPVFRIASTPSSFASLAGLQLPRIHRSVRYDTVLAAQWQMALPALAARRWLGRSRVYTAVHGREILVDHYAHLPFGKRCYGTLRRRAISEVDALLPVSRYALGLVEERGLSFRRAHVVENGCNPERFYPVDGTSLRMRLGVEDKLVMLSVGRLVERKGVDTVLQALPRILARCPRAQYLVAGTGPDRARLERLALDLGVMNRVRFLGHVLDADLLELHAASDVFVLAAREERPDVEGFGLVYLEAAACAKPAVGTRSGGVPEAVREGETGFLVPPADPEALADSVLELLLAPELRRRMGAAGRRHVVMNASWRKSAERILAALNEAR